MSFPRMRGDEPHLSIAGEHLYAFSPYARG